MIFQRLYVRLALTMGALFVLAGGALIWISAQMSEMHLLERTQRLNRDIALHAAEDMPLLKDGVVNEAALKELAHHVMFINPIVEVYLLDQSGRILSHALPYGSVVRDRVTMGPLNQFLAGDAQLPIFGDDPRNADLQKTFSVSPILDEQGETVAYLYTVLNGEDFDGIQRTLTESYNLRTGISTIALSLGAAFVAGLVLFFMLTRRLRQLVKAVSRYREDSFKGELALPTQTVVKDEIDELSDAIGAMSQRIEKQFDAQIEIDKNRRELIANVSHDLRTPVSSMQGFLETILCKDLQPQEREDYVQTAHKHCLRLNQLIGELFELSTLESGAVEPQWERFPVMELVQDIIHEHEISAAERGITLRAVASRQTIEVHADIAMIHRVLENLIGNALRFTQSNGEITISVSDEDERVRVDVSDNGEGIASKDIPHIFDRYYQRESTSAQPSRGLGLAIVKRIVELHRSRIEVQSERDAGTQFRFWLPQPG
ncbi:MAG: HAMP domain-containing sensor histidine kinase [Pseudomonadota bacterium]